MEKNTVLRFHCISLQGLHFIRVQMWVTKVGVAGFLSPSRLTEDNFWLNLEVNLGLQVSLDIRCLYGDSFKI